jgi:hypothetical protein
LQTILADAAAAYLSGKEDALDPAFMDVSFEAMLRTGGLPAAKSLADKALASEDPVFRPAALGAVALSGDPEIARWVLEEFDDPRLRTTEKLYSKLGVASTMETRDLGYTWLSRNLVDLMKGASGIFLARGIPGVLAGYCSADKADEMAATFRPIFAGTPGALELERTLARVRNCGALNSARGAELNAVVKKL